MKLVIAKNATLRYRNCMKPCVSLEEGQPKINLIWDISCFPKISSSDSIPVEKDIADKLGTTAGYGINID